MVQKQIHAWQAPAVFTYWGHYELQTPYSHIHFAPFLKNLNKSFPVIEFIKKFNIKIQNITILYLLHLMCY